MFDVQISHEGEEVVITIRDLVEQHTIALHLDQARANWWRESIWVEQMAIRNENLQKGN
jgi:hypothetical protein